MNVLFVCGRGLIRSPTAAELFANLPGVQTASGGVSRDADDPLSADLVAWADLICVMEPAQRRKLLRNFSTLLRDKRVVCLQIADDYAFGSPELREVLRERMRNILPELVPPEDGA